MASSISLARQQVSHSWCNFADGGASIWALSSQHLYDLAGAVLPWLWKTSLAVLGLGFILSLVFGVSGLSQLAVLHIPAVWMATALILLVTFWSALGLLTGGVAPFLMAQSLVPTGGMFSFLAIWSGALWNRASLGDWWIGDARQLAECGLLCLFLLMLVVPVVISQVQRADISVAYLGVAGGVSVAILYILWGLSGAMGFVDIANSTVDALNPATGVITVGFWLYGSYVGLVRLRCMIKEREFGVAATFTAR